MVVNCQCIARDQLITKADQFKLLAQFSVFLSRVMRGEEGDNSGNGYEDGQYPFVLYNRAVLPHKTTTKLLIFVFSFDLNSKLNNPIAESLVIVIM